MRRVVSGNLPENSQAIGSLAGFDDKAARFESAQCAGQGALNRNANVVGIFHAFGFYDPCGKHGNAQGLVCAPELIENERLALALLEVLKTTTIADANPLDTDTGQVEIRGENLERLLGEGTSSYRAGGRSRDPAQSIEGTGRRLAGRA